MRTPSAAGLAYEKTTLDNGLTVVTETIPSVRSVSLGVWVDVGSRDERAAENGLSHVLEHMVFKGTSKRRSHQINQTIEGRGGYLNAFTSKEHTCYYARMLDEHLDRGVDVLTDLVQRPTLAERDLEKEKQVILEELKAVEDAPDDLIFDQFEQELFGSNPLARPIIGTKETITSFTRPMVAEYVDTHYRPERMVLAAAGNLRHRDLVRLARKYANFDRGPKPEIDPRSLRLPLADEGKTARAVEVGKPISQAHLVIGTRALSGTDEDRYVMLVLNTLLGGGMSSRLHQNIREKYGFCYAVYSFNSTMSDAGAFGVYIATDPSKAKRSHDLIVRELRRLVEKPITPNELTRTKNQVKGSLMLSLESTSSRMTRLGRCELYFNRYLTLDEITVGLDAVTAADVQRLAGKLFGDEAFTSILYRPDGTVAAAAADAA